MMKQEIDTKHLPPPVPRNLRVYAHLDVTLTYQNFGSAWLCILRGSPENIDLVFNGFFNYGATNGDYQFFDHAHTVAIFWTDAESLFRCLYRMIAWSPKNRWKGKAVNMQAARNCMAHLREYCHESFMNFDDFNTGETYSTGTISAERPDDDFRDSVIIAAHTDKEKDKKDLTTEVE